MPFFHHFYKVYVFIYIYIYIPWSNAPTPDPAYPEPFVYVNSDDREEAIRQLLEQGRARLVVSTLGAEGCIVVTRHV